MRIFSKIKNWPSSSKNFYRYIRNLENIGRRRSRYHGGRFLSVNFLEIDLQQAWHWRNQNFSLKFLLTPKIIFICESVLYHLNLLYRIKVFYLKIFWFDDDCYNNIFLKISLNSFLDKKFWRWDCTKIGYYMKTPINHMINDFLHFFLIKALHILLIT